METVDIEVNAMVRKEFRHFYDAVGYANVDYTYTRPSGRMYDYLSAFHRHFRYMRMHNILTAHGRGDYYLEKEGSDYGNPSPETGGADGVVTMDADGKLRFDWTVVDRVYDILMAHHIRPIVETVYLPACLQMSHELYMVPRDYAQWAAVIGAFVGHLADRYGREEIENWYFEIWNEPDNHPVFREHPEFFFALYDYMEEAVHRVDGKLRVGGPATKQWEGAYALFDQFLEHCTKGVNLATGRVGTRLDFISVHCKGGRPESNCPSTRVMFDALDRYISILKKYPEYQHTEFFNDESDIVWEGNQGINAHNWFNFRNTHYAAGFTCKMVSLYCHDLEDKSGIHLSVVDSDNCHIHWEKYLFSGNRSQYTPLIRRGSADLIRKPVANAYVLLSRLGDERLAADCAEPGFEEKFGVLPTVQGDALAVMLWNFEDGMDDDANTRNMRVHGSGLPFRGEYRLLHYRIDARHSSAYSAWAEAGRPERPTVEQIRGIRAHEGLELYEDPKDIRLDGEFSLEYGMPMHSVSLLLLLPRTDRQPAKPVWIGSEVEKGFNGNTQVFLRWQPDSDFDFLRYQIERKKTGASEFAPVSGSSLNTAAYVDMDVIPGETVTYRIRAVNASLNESGYSEELTVET